MGLVGAHRWGWALVQGAALSSRGTSDNDGHDGQPQRDGVGSDSDTPMTKPSCASQVHARSMRGELAVEPLWEWGRATCSRAGVPGEGSPNRSVHAENACEDALRCVVRRQAEGLQKPSAGCHGTHPGPAPGSAALMRGPETRRAGMGISVQSPLSFPPLLAHRPPSPCGQHIVRISYQPCRLPPMRHADGSTKSPSCQVQPFGSSLDGMLSCRQCP